MATRSRNRDDDDDDDKDTGSGKGVSLRTKDAIESGGRFGPGPATINSALFAEFKYIKKGKTKGVTAPVLLMTYERDGEEEAVPYSVGSGWRVGKGGKSLVPRNGQEGLPNNCNAFYLIESMEGAGMPDDFLDSPDALDGLEVVLVSKPIERDFSDRGDRDRGRGDDEGGRGPTKKTLLVVSKFTSAPWLKGGKSKKAEDDDEDETPKKKKPARDDDDDEDEKPAKKKPGKSSRDDDDEDEDDKPAAKGKKKPAKGDDDDDDLDAAATEALIDALADGPMKVADLEAQIRLQLKGNAQRLAIAARVIEDDFLETEKGWTFDAKKGKVTLD